MTGKRENTTDIKEKLKDFNKESMEHCERITQNIFKEEDNLLLHLNS